MPGQECEKKQKNVYLCGRVFTQHVHVWEDIHTDQNTTLALATGGGSYFRGTATPRLSSRRGASTRGT